MTDKTYNNFVDEIPVRSAGGTFFVIHEKRETHPALREGRGGNEKREKIIKMRHSEPALAMAQEFRGNNSAFKKLQPPPPAVVPDGIKSRKLLVAPFIFSAEDEDEIHGKISNFKFQKGEDNGIKIREIERGKGNSGVSLDEMLKKRDEVAREADRIVSSIKRQVLNGKQESSNPKVQSSNKLQNQNSKFQNEEKLRNLPCEMNTAISQGKEIKKLEIGNWKLEKLNKFENLLKTRIKGSRNNVRLWEALVKSENEGGMGMAEKDADEVIKIVSNILNEVSSGEQDGIVSGIKYQVSSEEKESSKFKYQIPNKSQSQNFQFQNFYNINRAAGESGKPKLEDIKYKPKLTGPIEEIRSLRIKDLRALSNDANKALEIIKNKIDILEEYSFSKKIEGIKAWRESEIYKVYLEMGRRAISEKLEIGNLKLGAEDIDLTEAEFYAIMDLNKKLRF